MLRRFMTLPTLLAVITLFLLVLLTTMWLYGYGLFSTPRL